MMSEEPAWRSLSRGRCFVYLLPCRYEDSQKIGFARDPWQRMQSFHARFHDFFDLDRGALIEADQVVEARSIETRLKSMFAEARWAAPLVARQRAGGRYEWFRGIDAQAMAAMREIGAQSGYPLHVPLAPWLRLQWMPQLAAIRDWIEARHEWIEWLRFNADPDFVDASGQALRNRMEAWEAIGLPLQASLSARAWAWYRQNAVS